MRKRATKKKARPRNPREWYDNDVPQEGSWATPNEDGETWTIPDGSTFTTDGNYDIHRMLSGMVPPTQDEEEEEGQ